MHLSQILPCPYSRTGRVLAAGCECAAIVVSAALLLVSFAAKYAGLGIASAAAVASIVALVALVSIIAILAAPVAGLWFLLTVSARRLRGCAQAFAIWAAR